MNKEKILYYTRIFLCILAACACLYFLYQRFYEKSAPPVVNVPSTTATDIAPHFPNQSKATVKDISRQIKHTVETRAPEYHYYTVTQEAADQQAQEYGTQQHADKIVKTTREVEVKDESGQPTEQKIYENDYYGINLERKHKIKVGAAHVDNANYVTLTYQNRDIEYSIYGNQEGVKGGGVDVTIAKW